MFLADRYVNGTCPKCSYDDARGDQCDQCGSLLNAEELISPKCTVCKNQPTVKNTKHLFLDLPKVEGDLKKWIDKQSTEGKWSQNSTAITKKWISEGLKSRCITRDLKWGTPVPLKGYENKVFYVWFDAPIGYISITANYTKNWEEWWKKPENNVELYQFMGKDNTPFHTVIFPSSLLATHEPWTLVKSVSTTEYLTYESGKFSKSRGTGVFGNQASQTDIEPSLWRYYLLSNRPETSDSDFSWEELKNKINGELSDNLGNFLNRGLKFIKSHFEGKVPQVNITDSERDLKVAVDAEMKKYFEALEGIGIREGLRIVMAISKLGNHYIQEKKPWALVKEEGQMESAGTALAVTASLAKLIAVFIQPYLPGLSKKILDQLKTDETRYPEEFNFDYLPAGHEIGEIIPLIGKLQTEQIAEYKQLFSGEKDESIRIFPDTLEVIYDKQGYEIVEEPEVKGTNLILTLAKKGTVSEKKKKIKSSAIKGVPVEYDFCYNDTKTTIKQGHIVEWTQAPGKREVCKVMSAQKKNNVVYLKVLTSGGETVSISSETVRFLNFDVPRVQVVMKSKNNDKKKGKSSPKQNKE